MSSFRRTIFHRRKRTKNDQQNEDDGVSSINATLPSDLISHSLSAGNYYDFFHTYNTTIPSSRTLFIHKLK